jgi:hypothetical protein
MEISDFDWRIYGVTTTTQDLPAAGPGTSYHPVGTPVYPATVAEWDSTRFLFGTPSALKIAYDIALTASIEALIAKERVQLIPHSGGVMVTPEGFPHLYNYFERYMISTVFSLLTLEIFCNFTISSILTKKTVLLKLEKKPKYYSAIELQKSNISIITKLLVILPKILSTPSIETANPQLWEKIKELNTLRVKITHMKSMDISSGALIDRDSVFAEIINNTPVKSPFYILNVMDYYKSGVLFNNWIEQMRNQYSTRFQALLKTHAKNIA